MVSCSAKVYETTRIRGYHTPRPCHNEALVQGLCRSHAKKLGYQVPASRARIEGYVYARLNVEPTIPWDHKENVYAHIREMVSEDVLEAIGEAV